VVLVGLEHLHIIPVMVQTCSSIAFSTGMKFEQAINTYKNLKIMLTRNKVSLFCLSEATRKEVKSV